jgi:hypothetical protein
MSMGVEESFINAGVDLEKPKPSPATAAAGFPRNN